MDAEEFISVTDAAKRLGVHRNTIDLRCRKGIYDFEWSDGPKGRQKWVRLSSLDQTEPRPTSPQEHDQPREGSGVRIARPDSSGAILSVLSPILAQMRADAAENGMLKERVRTLEAQLSRYQQTERGADMSRPWWRKLFGEKGTS